MYIIRLNASVSLLNMSNERIILLQLLTLTLIQTKLSFSYVIQCINTVRFKSRVNHFQLNQNRIRTSIDVNSSAVQQIE